MVPWLADRILVENTDAICNRIGVTVHHRLKGSVGAADEFTVLFSRDVVESRVEQLRKSRTDQDILKMITKRHLFRMGLGREKNG